MKKYHNLIIIQNHIFTFKHVLLLALILTDVGIKERKIIWNRAQSKRRVKKGMDLGQHGQTSGVNVDH